MQNLKNIGTSTEDERRHWLSLAHREEPMSQRATLRLSAQGLLLQLDAERAFVAGAWASVIVMCQSVIEASLRDMPDAGDAESARSSPEAQAALDRIKALRNELLSPQKPGAASLIWTRENGNYIGCHAALEEDAKAAMLQMVRILYSGSRS